MTVSTTDSVIEYTSGGPAYPIPYRFLQNSDIQAVLVKQDGLSETLVLGTQYTLSGAGTQSGGTLTSAYAAGYLATPGAVLTISRVMNPTQPTDLRNQGRFLAETHETVFDRLTMLIQQGFAVIGRALLRPIGKNYYDAQGRQIKNVGDPTDAQDATTRSWVMTQVNSARTDLTNLAYALYNQSIAYAESLVAGVVGGYGSFLQAGLGAIARTFQSKMRDTVSVLDYGLVRGYSADSSVNVAQIVVAQEAARLLGVALYWPDGVYPFNDGIDQTVDWIGNGAPTMGTFPTEQDDKAFFRPGMKDQTPGCVLVFKGTGVKSATFTKGGAPVTATYMVQSKRYTSGSTIGAPLKMKGMALVLDFDLYDAGGIITTPSNDNRANYQIGHLINNCGRSKFTDRVVFGYFSLAGTVITGRDPDRIVFNEGSSSGNTGTAVWGDGTNGLSSPQFNNYEFFANDHHSRDKVAAQWGRCAFEIDGPIGGSGSINGLYVQGGAVNTYCNNPLLFGACNNVMFDGTTFELPDFVDSPGAETSLFIGTSRTGDVYFDGCRWTDNPIYGADRLSGQMAGTLMVEGGPVVKAFDAVRSGRVARLRTDASLPSLQLGKDVTSSTSGWVQRLNPAVADDQQWMFDNVLKGSLSTDGKLSVIGGMVARSSRSSATSPALNLHVSDTTSGFYTTSSSAYGFSLSGSPHTLFDTGALYPGVDAVLNFGKASLRWNNSFFAVAPTVSSDGRMKKVRGLMSDAELAAWESVQPKVYKMLDMIDEKGEDEARFHFGYIAQEVQQAFIDQGLDPARYALWCEDPVTKTVKVVQPVTRQKVETVTVNRYEIEIRNGTPVRISVAEKLQRGITEMVAVMNEDGSPATNDDGGPLFHQVPVMETVEEEVEVEVDDGTRLGLRYTECMVLESAYLRTMITKQDARIHALESK